MRIRAALISLLSTLALTTSFLLGAGPAGASGFERGPAPDPGYFLKGPFAFGSFGVANAATPGFGAATIYYPTSRAEGRFGGVAIVPGFTGTQAAVSWLGPRLASNGFVVITLDTNGPFDSPASRGTQLLAALDYLTRSSTVTNRVDPTRLAVMGHSMGGGGALEAAKARPSLMATVPLSPWDSDRIWPEIVSPTLIVGAEKDTTAPVGTYAKPMFAGIPTVTKKAYLELNDAGHSAVTMPSMDVARSSISWLKRFVDGDTRYDQFLCPGPPASPTGLPSAFPVSAYTITCPV
jgi:dienelactone hydrolase